MANRHLSRSIVLQTLFEWDFSNLKSNDAMEVLYRNTDEFADGVADIEFMKTLVSGIIGKSDDLNKIIVEAAPDWPLEKISNVDRNVLRIGLFELLFSDRDEVPPKVAINEAIELAKSFGGDQSGKFVNGVLGAVYKELGEPGKDQKSPKKEVPLEELPLEEKVGGVIYARKDDELFFALVHDVFGHWTLSKGGKEGTETDEEGLKRVIKEEIGLDLINIGEKLGENEYVANHPEKGKHRKRVVYYLSEAEYSDVRIGAEKTGLDDAKWFKAADILDLNFYNDIVPLMTKSIEILLSK
jgi:transcription antitermination protein NusB